VRTKSIVSCLAALSFTTALVACGDDGNPMQPPDVDAPVAPPIDAPVEPPDPCQPSPLRSDLTWWGQNRATLAGWLDSKGCASPGYDETAKPIALFDWDNTVVKNDVGDAITFYMIKQSKVVQPPNHDWKLVSAYMTDAAAAALETACGTTIPAGQPLPTATDLDCADELLSMYIDNRTVAGETAFTGHDYRKIEPTYAFTAQLLAGYTHAEISQFATAAVGAMLAAPVDTTQTVGTRTLNGWIRIYDQTRDLVDAVRTRGYDVWVITASPQDVVGALAPMLQINADHVVGIRSVTDANNKLTYRFEGCGAVPEGQTMIPYIDGKRCWVNKVIYGDTTAAASLRRPAAQRARQVFAAGDSDTDIEFARDSQFKIVLNRAKSELMCFAYHDEDGSWLVNPMFIQPRARRTTPFPCSTTACKAADGTPSPCLDETGTAIPDQYDRAF